jgi:hypothetical protein
MMSGPYTRIATPLATMATEPPRQTLRLRLKPKALTTGYVDGAWWPRSRDLSTESPALLAVLAVRLGDIERVTYNLTSWNQAPRRFFAEGRVVRLEGFHSQHTDTVTVIGAGGRQRLTLLVVPPETTSANAHHILMTASHRGNVDSIQTLIALSQGTPPVAPDASDAATKSWEVDGGRVYERA